MIIYVREMDLLSKLLFILSDVSVIVVRILTLTVYAYMFYITLSQYQQSESYNINNTTQSSFSEWWLHESSSHAKCIRMCN